MELTEVLKFQKKENELRTLPNKNLYENRNTLNRQGKTINYLFIYINL